MARLVVFLLLLMSPDFAAAQFERGAEHQQRVDAVRRQLQSSDPKEVAWGAFTAATYHLTELGPELSVALEGTPPERETRVIAALLDAIVQNRTKVQVSVLTMHLDRFPVQTLLAFRDATGDADTLLISRLASLTGERWYAVANLLLEHRAPRFAATLLSAVRFEIILHVVDSRPDDSGGEGDILTASPAPGVMVGDGMGMNLAGFPPTVEYRFASQWPDALVASTGPVTVFYSRHVHDDYQFGVASTERGGPTPDARLHYLQSLARAQTGVRAWRSIHDVSVPWRGEQDFMQQAAQANRRLQFEYDAMLEALVKSGGLRTEERSALSVVRFDIQVDDRRSARVVALPSIPRR